ncbi:hypothetical protein H744_1c1044 [Photobacterium gaetbulicola Gung47]|uniref:Uncharacterized protein n=1 Tax=Photobacterium gaetbulicola Gung47 TaxID=658445 RepID=A0A0C5WLT0_9GAMM|nr:DUF2569 domain-containing protein [Photobacterium gaetbulicola]AJR06069.1 hypothetical protein H744_1c1044 [Photobacterium gaetbulicola Gung47]
MTKSEVKGLSGWLAVIALGVLVSPIRLLGELFKFSSLIKEGNVGYLAAEASPGYIEWYRELIYCEIFVNLFSLTVCIYMVYLFFSKSKHFPKIYIFMAFFTPIMQSVDAYAVKSIMSPIILPDELTKGIFLSLITIVIWVPYMLMSKRVKNTFVEEKSIKHYSVTFAILFLFVFQPGAVYFSLLLPSEVSAAAINQNKLPFSEDRLIEYKESLRKLSEVNNKKLPVMIDSETRLDSSWMLDNVYEYRYTLVNLEAEEVDVDSFDHHMTAVIAKASCNDEFVRNLFLNNIEVRFSYYGSNGNIVSSFVFDGSNCEA